jgi:hypothetical protein
MRCAVSGGCAQDLPGPVCCLACLVCRPPVFIAAVGSAGGELFIDPGDFTLGRGEGFDYGQGLLAQLPGALDWLAEIGQPGCQAPTAFRRGPIDLSLLPGDFYLGF